MNRRFLGIQVMLHPTISLTVYRKDCSAVPLLLGWRKDFRLNMDRRSQDLAVLIFLWGRSLDEHSGVLGEEPHRAKKKANGNPNE
jgi:hypothetical protein